MKKILYLLLIALSVSCASNKSKGIANNAKEYEDFFVYLETNFSGRDIATNV
ncbi:MAG: hypothetical protein QM710_13260 [Flavobacterium sp.]